MAASQVKIVWSRKASRHLRSAYLYWSHEKSPAATEGMLERSFSAIEVLRQYPEAGRRGRIPGTRELVIGPTPFLVAYRERGERIEVLALLHGSKKWPDSL